jgi:carboxyl-terminal processing protease
MSIHRKQNLIFPFLIIVILFVFSLGFWFGRSQVVCPVCPPEDVDFSLLWEAWRTIEEKYVDKEKIDVQEMIYGAVAGMIKALDDPYTVFLKPDNSKRFIEDVKGTFEGVGMEISIRNNQLQVIAPLEGTPAQRAGLRSGDKIIKIDGESTVDMTIDQAVNLIRGTKGTKVVLTVFREEWSETKEIEIIRDSIDIPSLQLEIKEDKIAYLKLYHFSEKAGYDFSQAAVEILASEAEAIILDLRNNPGGYLEIAQDIAGWFLEKGEIVVIEDFGEDKESKQFLAKGNARLANYPLVVLINQGSASGSEILAGALRDNKQAIIIGQTSFGKGSVQELIRLKQGSSIKVTIAKWLTPKGDLITDIGLEPDIKVEITDQDFDQGKDPQLDKALETIKNIM